MAVTHVYHWKHGWVPLTHAAAMSKAKGNRDLANRLVPRGKRKTPQHVLDYHAESNAQARRFESFVGGGVSVTDTHKQEYKDYFGVGDHRASAKMEDRLTFQRHLEGIRARGADDKARGQSYNAGVALGKQHHKAALDTATENAQYDAAASRVVHEDHFAQGYGDGLAAAYEKQTATHGPRTTHPSKSAALLTVLAEQKRADAARIAGSAGTGDRAVGRLNPATLAQANRNTDSALQRHVAAAKAADSLDMKASLAQSRQTEATRTRLTPEQIKGATHVQDKRGDWHEVVKVNAKSVTVKTPHSWTDTIPIDKVHAVRTVSGRYSGTPLTTLRDGISNPSTPKADALAMRAELRRRLDRAKAS